MYITKIFIGDNMTNTHLISRSTENDRLTFWDFDPDEEELLIQRYFDSDVIIHRDHHLTTVGGYLLCTSPLDDKSNRFNYKLLKFNPTLEDPLSDPPIQEGSWEKEKFWDYYAYHNQPSGKEVEGLQFIGINGYVLSFLPTQGRGTYHLWSFDADAANPGGTKDPLASEMSGQDAFPNICAGHTLMPIANCVIDWVPADGFITVYSFDPQAANPLTSPHLFKGHVPDHSEEINITVVDDYLLVWNKHDFSYKLYRFDPEAPFKHIVKRGKLPNDFDANTSLLSFQSQMPVDDKQRSCPGTMAFMRDKIEHVVVYVLESRSFDNAVGWLYEKGEDNIHWVGHEGHFQGANTDNSNPCNGKNYHQDKFRHGRESEEYNLNVPHKDPFHGTSDSIHQQWSKGYEAYHSGQEADMKGFVKNQGDDTTMEGLSPEQLPILNGLAHEYGLSDEWFCSEAGGTTTNRATMATGSAFNITASYESGEAYTCFPDTPRRQSVWKVLANNGINDWKIYYSIKWGSPPFPYTYQLYLKGQVPSVDAQWSNYVQPIDSFMDAAAKGELPAFSFLEPVWFTPNKHFTSYHPSGDIIPGEVALNNIYNAIKDGPGWDKTLLLISFSKGGGLYDHVPTPHLKKAWPNDGVDGYDFNISGTRVPTLAVSPWVKRHTVFRSPTDIPFDSTSIPATVLDWFGVPRSNWGMGNRVPIAPTFESVLQEKTPRKLAPKFLRSIDKSYPRGAHVSTAAVPPINGLWQPNCTNPTYWNEDSSWAEHKIATGKASFGKSNHNTVQFTKGSQSTIKSIEFSVDAVPYTFELYEAQPEKPTLTVTGAGIVNHSEQNQTFAVIATSLEDWEVQLSFNNFATAGGANVCYLAAPTTPSSKSGGIIAFNQQSNAGSANFTVRTGSMPTHKTTVGAEVRFNHSSSAQLAHFTLYGTTGTDGDTFGSVVFHNRAHAHKAHFLNIGGTVDGGDGGNTQFYDTTSADRCTIVNRGGTHAGANGGDVAFDGTSTADQAVIINEASPTQEAYGGVTSFNNNWPPMAVSVGASAGSAKISNLGVNQENSGYGGHTKFTGMFGAGNAAKSTITNFGSTVKCTNRSGAGNTQFTTSGRAGSLWRPTAGQATISNEPASCAGGQAGYTNFAAYDFHGPIPPGPTAGCATIFNLGGLSYEAPGGYTKFGQTSTADQATLVATAGSQGGWGGRIEFEGSSCGGDCSIQLLGGILCLENYEGTYLRIGKLQIDEGGHIETLIGVNAALIEVKRDISIRFIDKQFYFKKSKYGFEKDVAYPILQGPFLSDLDPSLFAANNIDGAIPFFSIEAHTLSVTYK